MPVKLRLSRKGRKRAPFYHIIVADSRSPRDGKFIEKIGTYNPMTKPATIEIDRLAAYDWLLKGAQPTDTVKAILRFKGVYYRRHLMRGVKKGAMSLEQADILWQEWIDAKEAKIKARKADTMAELESFRKMVSGEAKAKVIVADESTKAAAEAFRDNDSVVAETHAEVVEDVATEVVEDTTPVAESVEEVAETVAEEVSAEVAEVVVDEVADTAVEETPEVEVAPEAEAPTAETKEENAE
jgi:small subunit ribosomal protein S16